MKISKKSITAASDNQTVKGTVTIYPDFEDYRDSVTTSMLKNQVSAVAPAVKFTCKKTGDQVAVTISGTADDVKKAQLAVESCDVSKKVSWGTKDVSAACGKKRRSIKSSTSKGRSVTAAEGDYIKIGNRILPKNAMDMGYDSYEDVSRKARQAYNAEKEEELRAAERAEQEAAAKRYIDAFNRIYAAHKDDSDVNGLMEELFDEFVPASGPTNSLAAEFIRAIERIRYRAYNDGDKFYTGYGLETAAPSAAFLADNLSEELSRKIERIADHDSAWPDSYYEEALDSLAGDIVEYIADNPHLFGEATTDSRDYNEGYYVDDWTERDHEHEYEPDTSGEYLDILLDHDIISWEDVRDFLENLTDYYGGEVSQWARDAFNIINLSSEEYYEWDDHFEGEWASFLDELMSEHEDEINDYDEEEEGYDEDEDIEEATKISAASTTYYADPNGIMGDSTELWTEESMKKYYDAEHNNDPVLEGYNSFEDWFYDTVTNWLVEVDASSETYTDSPTF